MTRRFGPVFGSRVLQVPLVAAAVALSSPAAAQNLIANGNFAINGGDSFNSAPPWVGLGSSGEYTVCVAPGNCAGFGTPIPPPAAVGNTYALITPVLEAVPGRPSI
jgi:hypothetical protein